jgi:hypothetical protein
VGKVGVIGASGKRGAAELPGRQRGRGGISLPHTPTATQLSQVISQVTALAFLSGNSVLIARMNRIIDGSQALNAIRADVAARTELKAGIPRLKRRAAEQGDLLLNTGCVVTSSLARLS